jgi:mono/diheme cytochrome c family protein
VAGAALVTLAALALAAPAASQAPSAPVTPALIARGDTIFHGPGLCFACHGADAKGVVGPSLADSTWLHTTGTYSDLIRQITAGVTQAQSKGGQIMPPKGGGDITEADVKAVAAYVWSLSHPGH